MTAEAFANLLQARRVGARKWIAKCPAHPDNNPSLSIAEGRELRTLVICRAGCSVDEVVAALGLTKRDLFAGPPSAAAVVRQLATKRTKAQAFEQARREDSRAAADLVRKLTDVVDALGARLAKLPEDARGTAELARLFHESISRLRDAERAWEVANGRMR